MSDNDKMREAIIQFGQDNPSLDLDFRLHTHGKYLTQEKAIVASRAFKAGAAWQAAQSEQSDELERLRKDAERYYYIRDRGLREAGFAPTKILTAAQDEAIDAAIYEIEADRCATGG